MRKFQLSIFSVVLIGGLSACSKDAADPSSAEYNRNDAEIKAYISQNEDKLVSLSQVSPPGILTASGLYYKITRPNPTGKQATVGDELEFSYKVTNLSTGLHVDSSAAAAPVFYPLGIRSVFPGLEQGLSLMREGEKAILLVPSYLAYNDQTLPNLPAYSVVRFDVTLNRSRSEDQQITDYIMKNKLAVTETTASGVRFIKTQTNASGQVPTAGQTLTIKYVGKQLRAATAFDSTGTGTADFVLAQNKLVKGFEEGLAKLRIGEKATVIFPSSLGYGKDGIVQNRRYVITPYAPLRFDIELTAVK